MNKTEMDAHKMPNGRKSKPRPGIIRNVLSGLFMLAVLVFVIVFIVFRDRISADTIRGIRQLIPFASEDAAAAEEVLFDSGRNNLYGFYDGKLAVLSAERLALYDSAGRETLSEAVSMENPALETSGGRVMAYDRGGGLLISDGKDILLQIDGPVYGAKFNSRQWFAVITRQAGYRGVITVYDGNCKKRYAWNSAKRYILDAAVSPSGKSLAVASVIQEGDRFVSRLSIHDTSKESDEPEHYADYEGRLAVSVLYPNNDRICIVMEDGVEFLDSEGNLLESYNSGGKVFVGYSSTQEFILLNMKYSETSQISELILCEYDGAQSAKLSISGKITQISAGGKYFSVLSGSVLEIYNEKCEKIDTLTDCADVKSIVQRQDGSVYLIAGDSARLYSPGVS